MIKKILRDAKSRTKEALEEAIAEVINIITSGNAKAWFRTCPNQVQLA
ncbi:MAG: hypothetical protein WB424_05390 [Terracidiphilus sp.]